MWAWIEAKKYCFERKQRVCSFFACPKNEPKKGPAVPFGLQSSGRRLLTPQAPRGWKGVTCLQELCGKPSLRAAAARHTEGMICASKSQRSGRGRQNFENSPAAQTTRILPAPIRSTPTALPSPPHEGALLALLSVCVRVTALGLFGTAHLLRLCRCPPRRGGHQPPKKYFFKKGHFRCFARSAKLAEVFPQGIPGLFCLFSCIGRGGRQSLSQPYG